MNVTVTRAFLLGGAVQVVGSSLELPDSLARELIGTGKARRTEPAPPKAPGPMTTENTPAAVKGKPVVKEKQDAGQ